MKSNVLLNFFLVMDTDWNAPKSKAVQGESEDKSECKPFDFNKCSLDQSLEDYPQLFEFQNDQIM